MILSSATSATPFAPTIAPVRGAALHVGGPQLLGTVSAMASSAREEVLADAFRIDHKPAITALGGAANAGARVSLLVDTRELRDVDPSIPRGVDVVAYGGAPAKQHSKSMSVDGGSRALVGTDLLGADAADKLEFAIELSGDAARAVRSLQVAARGQGGSSALREAADAAARVGVLANEPKAGVRHVSSAIDSLLAQARQRVVVVSRSVDDERSAAALAAAAKRGATVDLICHTDELPGGVERDLERAGVRIHEHDKDGLRSKGVGLHGLQLVADDHAIVSGAYLLTDMLRGTSGRQSRELGVLLGGADAARVERELQRYL